jgi:hypothetical protein
MVGVMLCGSGSKVVNNQGDWCLGGPGKQQLSMFFGAQGPTKIILIENYRALNTLFKTVKILFFSCESSSIPRVVTDSLTDGSAI